MVDFKEIIEIAMINGGLTLSPMGKEVTFADGYLVADASHNMNLASLNLMSEELLASYLKIAKAFKAFVGIYQRIDGSWDIDISHRIESKSDAIAFGLAESQESIWDAKNQKCIYLQANNN